MDDLEHRFARAERGGLIALVRARPQLPMDELLALVEEGRVGRVLGSLTLAECMSGEVDDTAIELVDKHTLREVHEARILKLLREVDEPLSPNEICDRLGGTTRETRSALQRLAAAKRVKRTWKARGHGYQLC